MRKLFLALGLVCSSVSLSLPPDRVRAALPIQQGTSPDLSALSVTGADVVRSALKYLGYRYTTVGNTPKAGFSCIGLVSYVYRSNGIPVPDDLQDAENFAPPVAFSDLSPGDVLFFQNTVWPGLSHTAIYLGAGRFIHAEWYNRGVVISSFNDDPIDGNYWIGKYLSANRPWNGPRQPLAPVPISTPIPPAPASTPIAGASVVPAVVTYWLLNLRSRHSRTSEILGVLHRGDHVQILAQRKFWDQVQLPGGAAGWVVKYAISTDMTSAITSVPTPPATTAVGIIAVSALRVHDGPSLTARVVTVLTRGTRVDVLNRITGWTEIRTNKGVTGWVSSAMLREM